MVNELKEFLRIFQGDTPLTAFLYQYVKGMYSKLLEKVVLQKVFSENISLTDMLALDLKDETFLRSAQSIDLNFATMEALREAKVNDRA